MHDEKQPSSDYPISVEPANVRVTVRVDGMILADCDRALILREAHLMPVFYIPLDDISMAELRISKTRTHCPYKGDASYFSMRSGIRTDVAWSYAAPFDQVRAIKDHLAFYPDRVDAIETAPRE
jgi:uncharacterized protein (DUF427 family)